MTESVDFTYVCQESTGIQCSEECQGLEECSSCQCIVESLEEAGGPWGDVADVLICLLPIIFLVFVTLKKNPLPTTVSLPTAALMLWWIRLAYLGSDVVQTCAAVVLGLHEAITPITIMAGAITLFETMEATYCLPYIMREMKALTAGHPVAELMLIYSFAMLVEGASGFGTPVALGAPMLVSTGNDPLGSVVVMLLFNAFASVWGAVGTPIWFGLGDLGLSEDNLVQVSRKAGIALGISAFLLVPLSLVVLVPFKVIRQNILFIFLALITSSGAQMAIASVDYQFPSLGGGLIGCIGTAMLISYRVGLREIENSEETLGRDIHDISFVGEVPNCLVRSYRSSHSQALLTSKAALATAPGQSTISNVSESNVSRESQVAENGDAVKAETLGMGSIRKSHEVNPETEQEIVFEKSDIQHLDTPIEVTATESEDKKETEEPLRNGAVDQSLSACVDEILGPRKTFKEGYLQELLLRTFPLWGVVLLLILTRVDEFGIRKYLTLREPYFQIVFGTYGNFRLSVSLVLQLQNILTYPNLNWRYELLFTPFLMPFVLISIITMIIYRNSMKGKVGPRDIASIVFKRLRKPFVALVGALSLVQLMIRSGTAAPAFIIGSIFADWFAGGFVVISPLLGALGSFFSGSTTVSNLTFGDIQLLAAESIGVSSTAMLALQCAGASAGNGICLNNIIAACTVVGLGHIGEGAILSRTYKIVFASTTISTLVMVIFFFRF